MKDKNERIRSITVEFIDDKECRTETHKTVFKVPFFLKPKKTKVCRYLKLDCKKKWVMQLICYGGKKFIFTNGVTR